MNTETYGDQMTEWRLKKQWDSMADSVAETHNNNDAIMRV